MTIVSFSRNFIFIKTVKTGGTSVEIALAPHCGPDDIIAPISMEDEWLRVQDGVVAARNFAKPKVVERYARAVLDRDEAPFRRARRYARQHGFHPHMTAGQIKRLVPPEFWQSAFKFTVERHPYERTISRAYWRLSGKRNKKSIDELIELCSGLSAGNPRRYSIDGKVVVDDFIRTESLAADLKRIAARLGFELADSIPRAKGDVRTDRRPATEILTEKQKQRIYQNQRAIFDRFNYQP
jgi:hypothetical protein